MTETISRVHLKGIAVDVLTRRDLIDVLEAWSQGEKTRLVLYANAHTANLTASRLMLEELWRQADLVFCDGVGITLAARMHGSAPIVRLAVMDWIDEFLATLEARGIDLFLLGDTTPVVESAAARMLDCHPRLSISGVHHGYLSDQSQVEQVTMMLRESSPSVILVGMGSPRQEEWMMTHAHRTDASLVVAVGGALRYYSGSVGRAPQWMRGVGLEWLWRLVREPRRLFRRYVFGIPKFLMREMLHTVKMS